MPALTLEKLYHVIVVTRYKIQQQKPERFIRSEVCKEDDKYAPLPKSS